MDSAPAACLLRAVFARKGHKELVAAFAARRPHEALLEVAAPAEALELGLHELRQRTLPALLEAREEAREVPTHEHRRVAVVGLARDVGARPCACGHDARPCIRATTRPLRKPARLLRNAPVAGRHPANGRATLVRPLAPCGLCDLSGGVTPSTRRNEIKPQFWASFGPS